MHTCTDQETIKFNMMIVLVRGIYLVLRKQYCPWDSFTERGKYESVLLNKQEFNCKDEGRGKPL